MKMSEFRIKEVSINVNGIDKEIFYPQVKFEKKVVKDYFIYKNEYTITEWRNIKKIIRGDVITYNEISNEDFLSMPLVFENIEDAKNVLEAYKNQRYEEDFSFQKTIGAYLSDDHSKVKIHDV
jgi:hypothetical protein